MIFVTLIEEDLAKIVQIGSLLQGKIKEHLIKFLQQNVDVFSWSAIDMFGIPLEIITHKLNMT